MDSVPSIFGGKNSNLEQEQDRLDVTVHITGIRSDKMTSS